MFVTHTKSDISRRAHMSNSHVPGVAGVIGLASMTILAGNIFPPPPRLFLNPRLPLHRRHWYNFDNHIGVYKQTLPRFGSNWSNLHQSYRTTCKPQIRQRTATRKNTECASTEQAGQTILWTVFQQRAGAQTLPCGTCRSNCNVRFPLFVRTEGAGPGLIVEYRSRLMARGTEQATEPAGGTEDDGALVARPKRSQLFFYHAAGSAIILLLAAILRTLHASKWRGRP